MNTFDLEFGLRTLHCKCGLAQLYGYYVVIFYADKSVN